MNDGDKHGHRGYNAMVDYQQALAGNWDLFGTTRWFPQHRPVRQILCRFRLGPAFHQRNETWTENQSYQLGSRYHDERYLSELRGPSPSRMPTTIRIPAVAISPPIGFIPANTP